jgi:TolA-binding protein
MTDDLLKRASSALREETADADEGARFTRSRVMASLQQSQIRRRSRVAVLLPLAACFAAASAFGMVTGRVPAFVQRVSHTLGFSEAPAPSPAPARRKPTSVSTPAAPIPTPSPAPTELAEPTELAAPTELGAPAPAQLPTPAAEPRAPEAAPHSKSRAPSLSASAAIQAPVQPKPSPAADVPASPALSDVSDRAHELYRVAHRSHFVDHDFVSALRAWDAYLEAAPNGRFVLEARYNRALCLVRLGRSAEARDALTPFANGKFAGYRQEEARSLIDALNH